MKVEITEKERAAIEQGLSRRGVSEVSVKVENGKIVVLQVEKKKIVLKENIKAYGDYVVAVKLYAEISAKLKVHVVREVI